MRELEKRKYCGGRAGRMPRFIPVQCHKCSVLQIKPAQKLGLKWCCSMCRPKAEVEAAIGAPADVESQVDVSLFEEAEEMGAVANTFRGVESLDCASYWEGLYYQSSKVQHQQALDWKHSVNNSIQIYEDDSTKVEENRVSKRTRETTGQSPFLSSLWGRWQQKAAKKEVVELMEFAGGLGNQENVPPPRS